jgi:hypothetical protein
MLMRSILTNALAGAACAMLSTNTAPNPLPFISPELWQLASVAVWAVLWAWFTACAIGEVVALLLRGWRWVVS